MVAARYLADITGPMGPVGNLSRGTMPTNSDADDYTTSGLWYTGGTGIIETQKNLAVKIPSEFFVLEGNAPYSITQFQMPSSVSNTNVYWRSKVSSGSWSSWMMLNFNQGVMPENTDMDEFWSPGMFYTGGAGSFEGHTNLAVSTPSNVIVLGVETRFTVSQIQIPVTSGNFYFRTRINGTTFSPWINLTGGGGGGAAPTYGAGVPSDLRIQAFKDEYPLATTGNKGVVVFRYDHGLTNLKDSLLPLHKAAGIPFYVAMNSRLWSEAENSGASKGDAKSWIASGIAEFGNHTSDHKDRNTGQGIYDTIVNGRKELEEQLGVTIHGFTVPGLTEYNKLEGFGSGSLDSYSDTLAGSLILANHAIASGVIGSSMRPLDGIVRQGGRHYTWESSSFTEIKTQIDLAVSGKKALTLMAHPRTMGASGYWTPSLAAQVINYVKTQIAAGKLANISYYQSHHAKL